MFKPNIGVCVQCNKPDKLIVVKAGYCGLCNHNIKKANKSNKAVRMINRAEKKSSHPELKKQLWELFSLYIRRRDTLKVYDQLGHTNEVFICISCETIQSTYDGNLQAGHYYKSETYPALRYDEKNVNGQCKSCNIFKEGNRQGYEAGLLKKYGQRAVDVLKIKAHNKVALGRFEMELLKKEYEQKLKSL